MPELILADGTVVTVAPPAVPRLEMAPPPNAGVMVLPVSGRPGPPGPPGTPGDVAGQLRIVGTAAGTLSGHRVVTRLPDGTIGYASNDDPAFLHNPLWLTTGAAEAAAEVTALAYGSISEGGWSWAPGPVYLGQAGLLTQTPPTAVAGAVFLAQVGCATAPTWLFVDRQPSISLI